MTPLLSMASAASAVSMTRLPGPSRVGGGKVASGIDPGAVNANAASPARGPAGDGRVARSRQDFEAFVLQSMLGAMVPKETAKLFGTGSAGHMWKSLLVEKMATEIARGGRLRLIADESFARSAGMSGAPLPALPSGSAVVDAAQVGPVLDGWETDVRIDAPFAGAHDGATAVDALAALDSWMTIPGSDER